MTETLQLVLDYARMVWRYRWTAIAAAGVVCLLGWMTVLVLPDQYKVSSKIFVDTRSMLGPALKDLIITTDRRSETARLVRRTLLSRPNLETILRKADLDLRADGPEAMEALIDDLRDRVSISGTVRDNIYEISYTNNDAVLATKVVEEVLNLLVESSLGDARKDSNKTRQFINEQIAAYEARLEAAENRLKEFRQRNVGLTPTDAGDYYSRLQALREKLANARLDLEQSTRRSESLRAELVGEEPTFGILPAPDSAAAFNERVETPLDERVREAEARLDDLRLRFTNKHPDVVAMVRLVAQVRARREAEKRKIIADLKRQRAESLNGPISTVNPVQSELTISLATVQGEIASLQARVTEFEKREKDLEGLVNTVPKIEAELTRLNRDYATNKRNYDELVKRRESLKLSDEANQTGEQVKFNIIDPPRQPLLPEGPPRELFSAGVLVAGLGAGIGLALLAALLRPAVYTRDDVERLTQLPVLGIVNRVWTAHEQRRRRIEIGSFAFASVVLLGVFCVLMVAYQLDFDLMKAARSVSQRIL